MHGCLEIRATREGMRNLAVIKRGLVDTALALTTAETEWAAGTTRSIDRPEARGPSFATSDGPTRRVCPQSR